MCSEGGRKLGRFTLPSLIQEATQTSSSTKAGCPRIVPETRAVMRQPGDILGLETADGGNTSRDSGSLALWRKDVAVVNLHLRYDGQAGPRVDCVFL